jgi:hypothetical protein
MLPACISTSSPPEGGLFDAGPREQEIDQSKEGIESHDVRSIRHEVGERVHVVVVNLAVAIVHELFDASHLDPGSRGHPYDVLDHPGRGHVALDRNAGVPNVAFVRNLAVIRRAKVEHVCL